jgi:hypothetical protein
MTGPPLAVGVSAAARRARRQHEPEAARYIQRDGTELINQPSKSSWTTHTRRETFRRPATSPPRAQQGDPQLRNLLRASAWH